MRRGAAALLLVLGLAANAAAAEIGLYSVETGTDLLRRIDTADGSTLGSVAITLSGETVSGATGLAIQPGTNAFFAVLKLSGGARRLVTVDPDTGVATSIGTLGGENFAGLAFGAGGVLYGVTGDGSATPETLFSIDTGDGTITPVLTLGNGNDGEALGFNPLDGLLYHASGHDGSDVIFESIDAGLTGTTNIDISGTVLEDEEAQALAWDPLTFSFFWKQDHGTGPLFRVTATGAATLIGELDHQAKGLAFLGERIVANGFLSPTFVRVVGGTLIVDATLDVGDKTVDFTAPGSLAFGSALIDLPDGFTPNSRGTRWSYISADRSVLALIVPANRRNGASRARFRLMIRNWADMLPSYPGGGTALGIALTSGDSFDVSCNVQLVGDTHRRNIQLASAPAVTLDRMEARLWGADTPRVDITASFAGDGTIPGVAPTVTLSFGELGLTYDVVVPTPEHVTTPTTNGYRFSIPDPPGPRRPRGAWLVDVDYVHRRVLVRMRGHHFGIFGAGENLFQFGLGLDGPAQIVQVCADRNGPRLTYR